MEYAILDEITQTSEANREEYQEKTNLFWTSGLEKLQEPWGNSDENLQAYIYHNYFRKNGPIDLLIIINEIDQGKVQGDFIVKKVETAVYPIYSTKNEEAIDIPAEIPAPDLHPDIARFIIEKRSLPKKKYNDEFDPARHKWDINRIAQELNMSNRVVARYCRAKNL